MCVKRKKKISRARGQNRENERMEDELEDVRHDQLLQFIGNLENKKRKKQEPNELNAESEFNLRQEGEYFART
jgi:hypothetical protein